MPAPTTPWRTRFTRADPFRSTGAALAALGMATAAWMAQPAAAASSPSRPGAVRASAPSADRAAVEAARRFLCPHGGTPRRGGRCRGGNALASAVPNRDVSARGWDAGLPAVSRRQAPCPAGTAQARVLFWDDAVRCVPR